VAVAGATGFVGRALLPVLARDCEVIGLGRHVPELGSAPDADGAVPGRVLWRRCDLFSLRQTEDALRGADVAYYLVHSMIPTDRLTQGAFEDLDLLLADNFARAAAARGVRRIVYLGGLIPHEEGRRLSAHLASRREVERALAGHGVPVTALRAGLVVGRGGSSLRILVRLVERLPAMLCPRWTGSLTQPIALEDVVALLRACLDDPETLGRVCEVGGPDVLSYREMMQATARVLGVRRLLVPVPFFSPGLSRLWVTLVTGTPRALVAPLVQSLRHDMVARDRWLQERVGRPGRPFAEALAEAVREEGRVRTRSVRSVQRLPLPAGRDAPWVAREYATWLPRALRPLLRVELEGARTRFHGFGLRRPLLELTYRPDRSGPDRALLEISGGLLVARGRGRPRLEFRSTPGGAQVLAAVHDFRPRLPWWLYVCTQAPLHVAIMRAFGRHLTRI
jgi:uncharacterized protein YbjT (DUF2867 family)